MAARLMPLALLAAAGGDVAAPLLHQAAAATPASRPVRPAPVSTVEQGLPATILVSIDGFRPDYLRRGNSPTLDRLADTGLSGQLRPSFPSVTFPNHYTIVTGRRPDRHGIVANAMTDPARPGVTFKLADEAAVGDRFWWDGAEPIWVTAERHGIRTATMFWPGTTAKIHGVSPQDWRPYDKTVPSAQRAQTVLEWLRRPATERPRFVTLYFDEVDTAGHRYGPDAPETAAAIRSVDAALATLTDGLEAAGHRVNFVIVSDHGMTEISPERTVDLNDHVQPADYQIVYGGPFTTIAPVRGKEAAVISALTGRKDHMTCWTKDQVPEKYRFGSHSRVPAIVCLADFGWQISQGPPAYPDRGGHGFDPEAPEMAALFIGNGPAFPGPRLISKTDNVQVYPLLMRLVGLTPVNEDALAEIAALKESWRRTQVRGEYLPDKAYP